MTKDNKHKCPLCGKEYDCTTSYGHDSDEVENYMCGGDYVSPCDNHTIYEIGQWCVKEGLIEDLPLNRSKYGHLNYEVMVAQGAKYGEKWV